MVTSKEIDEKRRNVSLNRWRNDPITQMVIDHFTNESKKYTESALELSHENSDKAGMALTHLQGYTEAVNDMCLLLDNLPLKSKDEFDN